MATIINTINIQYSCNDNLKKNNKKSLPLKHMSLINEASIRYPKGTPFESLTPEHVLYCWDKSHDSISDGKFEIQDDCICTYGYINYWLPVFNIRTKEWARIVDKELIAERQVLSDIRLKEKNINKKWWQIIKKL